MAAFQHEQIALQDESEDFEPYTDDDGFETEMVQTNASSEVPGGAML